jgi:hypothetical protein
MAYKPVQNESAHLTDKGGRSAFAAKSKGHAPNRMKKPMKLEKGRENKTRS